MTKYDIYVRSSRIGNPMYGGTTDSAVDVLEFVKGAGFGFRAPIQVNGSMVSWVKQYMPPYSRGLVYTGTGTELSSLPCIFVVERDEVPFTKEGGLVLTEQLLDTGFTTPPGMMVMLAIGSGADAGDWPELGEITTHHTVGQASRYAKSLGLNTSDWRNIDGMPPQGDAKVGPSTEYNCWHYDDDEDDEEEFGRKADSVARVRFVPLITNEPKEEP